ncbi:hypothetical protein UA08_07172 [Talaromyces atroroseus]|uniref:Transcription factor domain-containing protein n=1 Tax=Talaromyces atroroseus TaxID=1441469 RepID=A0A225A9Z4_TALAT|nr:hypothetical protein UA08_07172 [Talaromyces atroroseus]OKL57632.1 hypothetical protein UA08_07172 [Talaromyces atroroseus]
MAGEKGIRICGTKVRTGCLTCNGYAQDPKTLSMVIYRAPSISLVTTELERRSFAFFLDQTRNLFPIGFSNPLLQAAHENRALAHSVISLGALQQHFEHGDGPRLNISLGLLAAQQYGKALRALQSHNEPPSVDTLMICSIVFACFECLRGCRQAAIIHMKSGLDLFRRSGAYAAWNIVSEKTMGLLLIRWENQLIEMLGLDIRNDQSPPLAGLYFDDVNNFHSSLDGIINHILHAKHNLSVFEEHQTPWASPGRFSQISSTIEEWHHGFLISTSQQKKQRQQQLSEDSEGHGQDDPILLHIWYLLSKIYIAIQPAVDAEEAWDQFTGDFDTIVALSESYLKTSTRENALSRYLLE